MTLPFPCVPRALLLTAAIALATHGRCQPTATTPSSQTTVIAPTLSLGETIRSTKLEADDPEMKYQNGFFIDADGHGHIVTLNKDGRITGDFNVRPQDKNAAMNLSGVLDVAVFKDGSIVASWIYMLPHDDRRYFSLVHYDPAGNFLEQTDLGRWRALRVCVAEDKSVWTLSEEEQLGHPLYSPDEGVLRNYKFGAGLVSAVVPRANFKPDNDSSFPNYVGARATIDCSGDKIHVLTDDGKWIEYTPGADFTVTPIDPVGHSTYGDDWRMVGFAYLNGHAYAVIHSTAGDPFRRMLAELLPSTGGKTIRWVEVPPDKTFPANNQPLQGTPPPDRPKALTVVTGLLGADHTDGEKLVYRTSENERVVWSSPLFGSSDIP